jgi:hypothetical protein
LFNDGLKVVDWKRGSPGGVAKESRSVKADGVAKKQPLVLLELGEDFENLITTREIDNSGACSD